MFTSETGNIKKERARAIAFYLPQFHPIPENDAWWGKGFTEWTNVSRAKSLFEEHMQPQFPTDLGFYDLRLADSRQDQADLARRFGIEGFCYWHYWFNGKRLLERPFNEVLESGQPDFPFCLAWANETWTRRWLGEQKDVLMEQTYSDEDDLIHIHWLIRAFEDDRYMTVSGRPIFLIYRPSDLLNPWKTTNVFRQECLISGIKNPYLIGVNGHDVSLDSRMIGFDATLHFMPQLGILPEAFEDRPLASRLRRNLRFGVQSDVLKIYDYKESVKAMLSFRESLMHPTIPSIFVGWDNTPRQAEKAIILTDPDPGFFQSELSALIDEQSTKPFDERIVFLNAWNEWAEGNHLEPCLQYGRRFLKATRNALYPAVFSNMKNLANLSDEEWFDMLLRSLHSRSVDGVTFPAFPAAELQSNFVGSSNESALQEGFKFYQLVKSYANSRGKPFDNKTSRFLDFGCSWGWYLRIFRKDFEPENMFGVDVDPTVLDICKKNGVQGEFQTITPVGHLPYPDDFFDCVIAYSVFTHLPEHIHLHWVREIARVAKPGCIFVLTLESVRFIDFIQSLAGSEPETPWHVSLSKFSDQAAELRKQFYEGKFVYIPGGGDYRSADVYGEAVVSEGYVKRFWDGLFEIIDYIDDTERFMQAVLVAQKFL